MEIPEIDKQVTAEVHAELAGEVIQMTCPVCRGDDSRCDNCGGTGTVLRRY